MLVIRFFRTGKKNQSFFKVVVTDKRKAARGGRFVEEVGFVNPLTKKVKVNADRVKYWISVGAKPSDTVHNLLIGQKVIEGKKIASHSKRGTTAPVAAAAAPAPEQAVATPVEKPAEPAEEKPVETETPAAEEVKEEPKEEVKTE